MQVLPAPEAARPPSPDPSTRPPPDCPCSAWGSHRSPHLLHAFTCAGPGSDGACGVGRRARCPGRGEVRRRPGSGPLPGSAQPAPRLLLCPPSGAGRRRRGQPQPGLCACGEGSCPLVGSRAPTELPLGRKVAEEPWWPQEPPQPRGGGSHCSTGSAPGPPGPSAHRALPFPRSTFNNPASGKSSLYLMQENPS